MTTLSGVPVIIASQTVNNSWRNSRKKFAKIKPAKGLGYPPRKCPSVTDERLHSLRLTTTGGKSFKGWTLSTGVVRKIAM